MSSSYQLLRGPKSHLPCHLNRILVRLGVKSTLGQNTSVHRPAHSENRCLFPSAMWGRDIPILGGRHPWCRWVTVPRELKSSGHPVWCRDPGMLLCGSQLHPKGGPGLATGWSAWPAKRPLSTHSGALMEGVLVTACQASPSWWGMERAGTAHRGACGTCLVFHP